MEKLRIETMQLGMIATNCYLVIHQETGEALLIDPADAAGSITARLERLGVRLAGILLTHGHFDHMGAADAVRHSFRVPVCAMNGEQEILGNAENNLSSLYGRGFTVEADHFFRDGEEFTLAGFRIQALHTPGHTAGGCCYYFPEEHVLFSGDTLFFGSVGRTDFPTGSMSALHRSVHEKLFVLPEDTRVLPGHGEESTIGYEKKYNPY